MTATTIRQSPDKLAYTIKEAATACGVSEPVIRRAIAAGDLVPSYPTSRPVIPRAELESWLASLPATSPKGGAA